jgi:tyrosyl-tRNA synthetase
MLHSQDLAQNAQIHFEKTVQGNELPNQISEININSLSKNQKLFELLVSLGLASSNSDAKRLITQNAVKLNGQIVNNPNQEINPIKRYYSSRKKKFYYII